MSESTEGASASAIDQLFHIDLRVCTKSNAANVDLDVPIKTDLVYEIPGSQIQSLLWLAQRALQISQSLIEIDPDDMTLEQIEQAEDTAHGAGKALAVMARKALFRTGKLKAQAEEIQKLREGGQELLESEVAAHEAFDAVGGIPKNKAEYAKDCDCVLSAGGRAQLAMQRLQQAEAIVDALAYGQPQTEAQPKASVSSIAEVEAHVARLMDDGLLLLLVSQARKYYAKHHKG